MEIGEEVHGAAQGIPCAPGQVVNESLSLQLPPLVAY